MKKQNTKAPENPKKGNQKPKRTPRQLLVSILKILALPAWVAVVTITVQYIVIYSLYFILGRETLTTPVWTAVADALIYSLSLLVIIFVPIKIFKIWPVTREGLGLKDLPTWIDIGLAPVGFFVYLILATILVTIFSIFPFFDASEAQDVGFQFLNSGLDRLVAFIALVIVAPIAEEIMFRGWLYGKLRAKIPGKHLSLVFSILITSLLFAIMHAQWNVGVNVFAMSIILCVLREITGTIYSGILLHMIKNGIAFVMLYILNFGF